MSEIQTLAKQISDDRFVSRGKGDKTRLTIVNAALEFLWSHPFREMNVSLLMSKTGIARSAFYQYFDDLYQLMEYMMNRLEQEIMQEASDWFNGHGNPVELLQNSLKRTVNVFYFRGPLISAIADAAATDVRVEQAWQGMIDRFDAAVLRRVQADQELGLIRRFDSKLLVVALNRMDAFTCIWAFGKHPRQEMSPIADVFIQVWVSTLYGDEYLYSEKPPLCRPGEQNTPADA